MRLTGSPWTLVWCPGQYWRRVHEGIITVDTAEHGCASNIRQLCEYEKCNVHCDGLMGFSQRTRCPTSLTETVCVFLFWLISLEQSGSPSTKCKLPPYTISIRRPHDRDLTDAVFFFDTTVTTQSAPLHPSSRPPAVRSSRQLPE